jgi:thiol-disulfide isomerase/thioredoxin
MRKSGILFLALVLGLLLWAYYTSRYVMPETEIIGQSAPAFETETLAGEKIILKDWIGKKVILVNFWATWCEPCREEMPLLNSLVKGIDPSHFALVSILENSELSDGETQKALDRFQKKIPIGFPVYQDPYQIIADLYGTYKIPESYLIDLKGVVVKKMAGPILNSEKDDLISLIADLASRRDEVSSPDN